MAMNIVYLLHVYGVVEIGDVALGFYFKMTIKPIVCLLLLIVRLKLV